MSITGSHTKHPFLARNQLLCSNVSSKWESSSTIVLLHFTNLINLYSFGSHFPCSLLYYEGNGLRCTYTGKLAAVLNRSFSFLPFFSTRFLHVLFLSLCVAGHSILLSFSFLKYMHLVHIAHIFTSTVACQPSKGEKNTWSCFQATDKSQHLSWKVN